MQWKGDGDGRQCSLIMFDTAGCSPLLSVVSQPSCVTMALRSPPASIVTSLVLPLPPSIQCKQVTRNTFRYLSDMRTELCVALGKTLLSVINGDIKAIHPVLSNRDCYQLQEPKLLYDA